MAFLSEVVELNDSQEKSSVFTFCAFVTATICKHVTGSRSLLYKLFL